MNNLNDQKIGVVNPVVVNKTPVNAVKANIEPAVLNMQLQDSSTGLGMSSVQKGNVNQQAASNTQPKVNSQPAENKKPSHENFADKPGQQSAFRRSQMTSLPQSAAQPVAHAQQMPNKPYMNQLGNDVAAATILTNNNINNQRDSHQMVNHHSQHYQQQQQQQQQQLNHSQIKTSGSSQNIASNVNLNSSQNSNSNAQMLNQISPQNSKQISQQQQQQQQMVMQQVTNLNQQNANNPTNLAAKQNSLPSNSNNVNANGNNNSNNNVMAPPPGVNMINPNNQFMMSLPFVCYDVGFE